MGEEVEKGKPWRAFGSRTISGIVVGIILLGSGILAERYWLAARTELSYTIRPSVAYVTPERVGEVEITIDGKKTSNLYATEVQIWNSGNTQLENLPVLLSFNRDPSFHVSPWSYGGPPQIKVFNIQHATMPEKQFGQIEEESVDRDSFRLTYELLNVGDRDTITLLTNLPLVVKVYAKSAHLKLECVEPGASMFRYSGWLAGQVFCFAGIIVFISMIIIMFKDWRTARSLRIAVERELGVADSRDKKS